MELKNIQIIDGADNTKYPIFSATDDEFHVIFPDGNDIEFIEDLIERIGDDEVVKIMRPIFDRPVPKEDVIGIHGTLFYELVNIKKRFYPTKRFTDDRHG